MTVALVPWPASLVRRDGRLRLSSPIRISAPEEIAGVVTLRLTQKTGIAAIGEPDATIRFTWNRSLQGEAYRLTIDSNTAKAEAGTSEGLLRAAETLLQLIQDHELPCVDIEDRPRFRWRGVLIDPARHFLPVDLVKRFLDGMAAVKLNVLHWHLSDDQGFRMECRSFPGLHKLASDGQFYRQGEVADVIRYAAERAIRVVPEFDIPGHTTSWLAAYPSLGSRPGDETASQPGHYSLQRSWGPSQVALDPTREEVFEFLERFLGEMCAIFPDDCFHIGGDEVLPVSWISNPRIVAWMRDHEMTHTRDLQVYFNQRISRILEKCGKRMVGWDEVLHQQLPSSAIVQSWRGQRFLADALVRHEAILSSGYYLDQLLPASYHYLVDPEENPELTAAQKQRILGGEACLWGEYIGPENFDSRAWPRLCAVAERLWSPAEQRDVEDLYARLQPVSAHLQQLGARHHLDHVEMLSRLAGGEPVESLRTLAEVVEPVKFYDRAMARLDSSLTPLNRLVDAVNPESETARRFSSLVAKFCAGDATTKERDQIASFLQQWREHRNILGPVIHRSASLREVDPVSRSLAKVAEVGLQALERIEAKRGGDDRWWVRSVNLIERAKAPRAELILPVLPAIRQLVDTAYLKV